ncbi:MAG: AAA family ATPase [Actinomycetes bacterium]
MDALFAGEEVTGEVLGLVYADTSTGFGVAELSDDRGEPVRATGPLSDLVEGQTVRLVGRWTEHARYGPTFEATYYEQTAPTTVAGLRTFLLSERFAAVPHEDVERVLTVFGAGAGAVIEDTPARLIAEAGLEHEVATELHERWCEGRALAALVRLCEPAKLPMNVVRAVHARFGVASVDVAREDPYALLEVDRVRFAHADALARHLGIEATDPRRLAAGALAAVAAARRQEGHQFLTRTQTVQASAALLGVDVVAASAGVDAAVARGRLTIDELPGDAGVPDAAGVEAVYTPGGLASERRLAGDVVRLLGAERSRLAVHADRVELDDELTEGQSEAVRRAFATPVSVLTGGPGTGKTRTVREVVRAAEDAGMNVALCAPTGRAAKRIEELVGRPATTVHKLLEARPLPGGGFTFRYGEDERLPHDLVVCDEVSMCDTTLASRLVAAIDDRAHLLLVGDPDQLPSVGPGDVLRDLLRSGVVPATSLTEVHRQAASSRIVSLAHEIDRGEVGHLAGVDGDVFLAEEGRREAIVPRVVEAVATRAPTYFGVEPDDIQVIAPIYRGPAGVDALNEAIKARVNPAVGAPDVAGFHVGDRVMQTRNDAELDVSNGDIGTVVDLDRRAGSLRVAFPRGEVSYDRDQARDLTLAWAITVHKSQGGEWPVIVLVCDRSHRSMLWRNLIYTAVTRASRALIVVGQSDALRRAASHDVPRNRQTGLAARLRAGAAERAEVLA